MSKRTKSNNSIASSTDNYGVQSTNVESPPRQRAPTNRSRIQYQEVIQQTAIHSHHFMSGYEYNDFVLPDGDGDGGRYGDMPDSLGFMPVREGGSRKRSASRNNAAKAIGKPINADRELEGKTEYERDIAERFLLEARELRQKIMAANRWDRIETVFTDYILRAIGLRLPKGTSASIPYFTRAFC